MTLRHVATAFLALAAAACRAPRAAAPAPSPTRAAPSHAERAAAARPEDGGALLIVAWERSRAGDPAGALVALGRLDALGWDVPLDPGDFPALASGDAFRALAARVAARAPRTGAAALAHRIGERGLVPEGIAVDPEDGALYVGSIARRKIVRVDPGGAVRDLVPAASAGLPSVLGLKVDAARGLLWAAANTSRAVAGPGPEAPPRSGLFAFDRHTGEPRRRALLEGAGHLFNDLAIASDGTVYVTDSGAGGLWRLAPGTDALVPVVAAGRWIYPNGIVLLGDDRVLVAHALGIDLVPVDGREPRPITGPRGFPLGGIDGLTRRGRTLVAVQNGLGTPRIVRLELDGSGDRVVQAEVLETGNPRWHVPTTGDVSGDAYLYIANSHIDALSDAGIAPSAAVETEILRLPLPARR